MKNEEIKALLELEAKATPGPEEARYVPAGMPSTVCAFGVVSLTRRVEVIRCWMPTDAALHASARNAIRPLCEEVLRLRNLLDRLAPYLFANLVLSDTAGIQDRVETLLNALRDPIVPVSEAEPDTEQTIEANRQMLERERGGDR